MARRQYFPILAGALALLVILILVALHLGRSRETSEPSETAAGVQVLQEMEAKDPDTVVQQLKYLRQQRLLAQREEWLRQLDSGEISVWTMFDDFVLLGDSRATGFSYYGFLPESRVIAENGATIYHLEEHIPDIVELNPTNIFLCYGLNDVSIGYWPTPEEYVEKYVEILESLHSQLPDAHIYLSSILPARDPAFQTSTAWYNIPEYSAAVGEMCENIPYCYFVDNDETAEEYSDLWDVDGIHVRSQFYEHWAYNMIAQVLETSVEEADETSAETP